MEENRDRFILVMFAVLSSIVCLVFVVIKLAGGHLSWWEVFFYPWAPLVGLVALVGVGTFFPRH